MYYTPGQGAWLANEAKHRIALLALPGLMLEAHGAGVPFEDISPPRTASTSRP